MKVTLVLAVLCLAFASSEAFRGGMGGFRGGVGGFRGGFGGMRGGFGLGFGRFGLGMGGFGWGMGPWGFGGMGPWGMGMGGLGMGGLGMGLGGLPIGGIPAIAPGLAIGKRAADSVVPTGLVIPQINNGTVCTYAEKNSTLSCMGNTFNFECSVVPSNLVDFMPIRTQNLTVVLDERVIDGIHIPIFRLFSRVGHVLNNFSLIGKDDKRVVFSVYNNDMLTTETGIRVKDTECWTAFVRAFREVVPSTIDFDFVETRLSTAPATKSDSQ